MKSLKCPICGSRLTKTHYERALGIVDAQQKVIREGRVQLEEERRKLTRHVAEAKAMAERKALEKTQRLIRGKDKMIETLKKTVRQLGRGTTPQTEGLEFEENLVARLKTEFPVDQIEHKGQAGDILHTVFDGRSRCGLVVYELKRTRTVQSDHVREASEAKRSRGADIAILVTTGTKRGFNGFSTINDVPVVAPQAVIPLVAMLRGHLIQVHRADLSKEQREVVARKVVSFLSGAHFKNHMEGVMNAAMELHRTLKAEVKAHVRTWGRRWKWYQNIAWDGNQIKVNLAQVLQGKEPKATRPPQFRAPLLLPGGDKPLRQ